MKLTPLLTVPETVTTNVPDRVAMPKGIGATMLVSLQFVGVSGVPLQVIVLDPWLVPKLVPETVIEIGVPYAADTPVIAGFADVLVAPAPIVKNVEGLL